ncbi:CGNR zinc finger domain-containing protein, partial [Streptomyces venezuelae]|uniref:CGNR zinc finger domain-containing protein n=1 Tax=Streptomyces venezuelae TaxID=54571 RepID=UPI003F68286E
CRNAYLDPPPNRSRRYCSDRCATRANVAAYRARKRQEADRPADAGGPRAVPRGPCRTRRAATRPKGRRRRRPGGGAKECCRRAWSGGAVRCAPAGGG